MKTTVYVEFASKQIDEKDIVAQAKQVWKEAGNKAADLKTVQLYVKPEDSSVYYVMNDDVTGKFDI